MTLIVILTLIQTPHVPHMAAMRVFSVVVLLALNIQLIACQTVDAPQLAFRATAPPVLGMISLALITGAIFYFGRASGIEFLPDFTRDRRIAIHKLALYGAYGYLTMASLFMFFSIAWVEAYMLAFISAFALYHVWIQDRRGIFISMLAGVFLELVISGKLTLFGFNHNLADLVSSECLYYFYGTYIAKAPTRCDPSGYLNLLRLLGLAAIIIQPIAIYFSYSLYEILSARSDGVRAGYSSFRDEIVHQVVPEEHIGAPNPPLQTTSYQSYQGIEEP